jgi:phosphoribosylamine---glycine ligase
MKVLLLGSGGREHALSVALVKSPSLTELFVAPGNPGTAQIAINVGLDLADHTAIVDFCKAQRIDLVIVGPEAPLAAGVVDDLAAAGVRAFGPSKAAARLEGSKGFAKDLCRDFGVPTAPYGRFSSRAAAAAHLQAHGAPIVVKADGLAAGKGVTVAQTLDEARAALDAIFSGTFGPRAEVVIEDVLVGEEVSFFVFSDGERAIPFASAQDHKRAFDGDVGPNTGGMGAYSPAPIMTDDMSARAMREIVEPILRGMKERGSPFCGVLFVGLMVGPQGPSLIEFNVRFGDPEAQVILPRFEGDLLALMLACVEGRLDRAPPPRFAPVSALTVVLAAKGYPQAPETGARLQGLERAAACEDVQIYQAGSQVSDEGLVACGGRVLSVTGLGANLKQAQRRAYAAIDVLSLPGGFYRKDIGWRALAG